MQHKLKKFAFTDLTLILAELDLANVDAAINLEVLQQAESDLTIFNTLIEKKYYPSAIKFLALGLPQREAVWWAYICAEQTEKDKGCLQTQAALKATQTWVYQPNETNRRQAEAAAKPLELYTPSSWVAMAAFWSGTNIAPADKPAVQPDKFMPGHAVSNAIVLATEQHPAPATQAQLFLKQGLHICMGGNGRIS